MKRGFAKSGVVNNFDKGSYSFLIEIIERHCAADEDANRMANSRKVRNYILGDLRIGFGYDSAKSGQLFYWMFGDDESELALLERAINNKWLDLYLN